MISAERVLQKGVTVERNLTDLRYSIATMLIVLADYTAVVLAGLCAWYLRGVMLPQIFSDLPPVDISSSYIFFIIPLVYIAFLFFDGMYVKRIHFWQCVERLFKISGYVTAIIVGILYFSGVSNHISRAFMLAIWVCSFSYLTIARYFVKRMLISLGLWKRPVIIIGAGETAELIAGIIEEEVSMGYEIVGMVEDNYGKKFLKERYPVLGSFATVEETVQSCGVKDVIIAVPGLERDQLLNLVYRVQPHVTNVTIVPDLFGVPMSNMEVETYFKEKIVLLKSKNNLHSISNAIIKRIFDLCIGVIVTVFIVPLIAIISILIKLDSPGPVFHIAERLGKNGEHFKCYKFRSMHVNADKLLEKYFSENISAKEEWNKYAKLKQSDPRVTNIGKQLRKYSLDELPQIVNVLKGEMSLVGPRPYLPREIIDMGHYKNIILEIIPGITGLWQVSGRNDLSFKERLHMDCWYVRNWSFWLDIVMLFKTAKVVMLRKGAY